MFPLLFLGGVVLISLAITTVEILKTLKKTSHEPDDDFDVIISNQNKRIKSDLKVLSSFAQTLSEHKRLGYEESFSVGINFLENTVLLIEKLNEQDSSNHSITTDAVNAISKYSIIVQKIDTLYGKNYYIDMNSGSKEFSDKSKDLRNEILSIVRNSNAHVLRDIEKFDNAKSSEIQNVISVINKSISIDSEHMVDEIFAKTNKKNNDKTV